MCVCVCARILGSKCLSILLLRDDFERLKCGLDLWLSCMFYCIHLCVFLFFEKLFLSNLDSSSTPSLSIELFSFFLSQSRYLSIARSINQETLCPLDSSLIALDRLDSFSTPLNRLRITKFRFLDLIFGPCLCVCVEFLFSQP